MVNGLHLQYIALSQRYDQSKRFTIIASHSPIHTHIHPLTAGRPCKATASSPGAVTVRRLAQGHLGT